MGNQDWRAKRRESVRQEILDAAAALFAEEGIERTTMRKIAARVGVSPAALYRYFPGQAQIFLELRQAGFDLLYQKQCAARSLPDVQDRARAHALAYLNFAFDHPQQYELMFMLRAPMNRVRENERAKSTVRSYELLQEDVVERQGRDPSAPSDTDVATIGSWATLHGIISLYLRDRFVMHGEMDRERLIEIAMSYLFPD